MNTLGLKTVASFALGVGFVLAAGATPGCNCSDNAVNQFRLDLTGGIQDLSGGGATGEGGMVNNDELTPCGDFDPNCTVSSGGPTGMPPMPFPLPTDDPPPSNVKGDGVGRDPMGDIILNSSKANFDFIWVADDTDYNIGFVSKISTKARTAPAGAVNGRYNEVARYVTVTCYSDNTQANWPDRTMTKLGQPMAPACDGTKGCCDNSPAPKRTAVNLQQNRPSRTAVDFNGDLWVSNRAFSYQSSVSKIANKNDSNPAMSDCIDRNANGKIDTSSDANGDGIIDTDCNQNNIPDDLIDTDPTKGGTACVAGHPQEFFGLDDECILFTTNTGPIDGWGRPLALGPGSNGDFGPSDAWPGRYQDGTFYRVNGKTGYIITTVKINDQPDPLNAGGMISSHPYGATIDQFGILWAPNIDGHYLFYFDTNDPNNAAKQGVVGAPTSLGYAGTGFYGVSIDGYTDPATTKLVQQVWMAHYGAADGGAFRYRPSRTGNFTDLKNGTWAYVNSVGSANFSASNGRGIAVDNRTPANVWIGQDSSPGGVGRVPAAIADGAHVAGATVFRPGAFAGNATLGVGVANDLDIWAVNQGDSSVTHYSVNSTTFDLTAADKVTLDDNPRLAAGLKPNPYTYSDFTGFGLRNFTNPHGFWSTVQTGCANGLAGKTKWLRVEWDGDTPPGTSIQLKVRSADDLASLGAGMFSAPYTVSPADLMAAPALMPDPSGYLEIEFDLSTMSKDTTPVLKGYRIIYECITGVG
jgi:hypothetical protein